MQGANLANARLGAAILKSAQLQGASFQNSVLTLANFTEAAVWRGHAIGCLDAYVEDPNVSPSVDTQARAANQTFVQLGATRQILEKWVRDLIAGLPEAKRAELEEIFYIELMAGSVEEDRANGVLWRRCEAKRDQEEVFLRKRATFFGEMVCADTKRLSDVIVDVPYLGSDVNLAVGTRLLGQDSKLCPGAEGLLEDRKQKLREWITGSTSG